MKKRWLRPIGLLCILLLLTCAIVMASLAESYTLSVEGGEGGGKFAAGEKAPLRADAAPAGKVFYRWTATAGVLDDAYAETTQLTMPAGDVTVAASYTDKARVSLSGVSVASKVYDGEPAAPAGAPKTEPAAEIPSDGYAYAYFSTDGGGYASAEPPKNAGAYRLIVTVADEVEGYFGTSGDIAFTIAPATRSVTPAAGQTRYIGLENPAFAFTASGAMPNEVPAFSGALSGTGDASAAAGSYAFTPGTLALKDNGAFLQANYTLALTEGGSYAVVPLETEAVAAADAANLGANGVYTGDITLLAPEDYTIALSQTGADYAASVTVPAFDGERIQYYYLKAASGAVTGAKHIRLRCTTGAPAVSLYSPSTDAAVAADQKIILRFSEAVTPAAGKRVAISAGGESYTAEADKGVLTGDPARGPWYALYDLSQFTKDGAVLTLRAGQSYAVSAEAGAFVNAAGLACAALEDASFSTGEDGGVPVIFALDADSRVTDADGNGIVSGQAVPQGTTLRFPTDFGEDLQASWTVRIDGAAASGLGAAELAEYTIGNIGILEVYALISKAELDGAAEITGTARYGETLTAGLSGAAAERTLSFVWYSGGEIVQHGAESRYVVRGADIGRVIRVEITAEGLAGARSAETAAVEKALYAGVTPSAPALAARTTDSVTLAAGAGMEYRVNDGAWQDSPLFEGLSSGTGYRFSQRVKETALCLPSEPSAAAEIATYGPLSGTIELSGAPEYGASLTARLTGTNNEGALSWTWKRGDTLLSSAESYTVTAADIGHALTVEAVSSAQGGSVRLTTAAVAKAAYAGAAPSAPTAAAQTAVSVTLNAVEGCEYSCGGEVWQTNTAFTGLAPGTTYSFYQR
ncbi:MAG: MBG domain-containing protein, partial [Clostridia bacterium]|nr:MBG domain-containing protein [Clostridia bacterium]